MAPNVATLPAPETQYPDSDGKRMADNTKQAHWITLIYDNLKALYGQDANVFVAADNLIYPVRVEPPQVPPSAAPDVYVVFGRHKGHRGSYSYWLEDDVPVTVAFEILSPSNTYREMENKWEFYNDHGIGEYYIYDPENNHLTIYIRGDVLLVRRRPAHDFVSPLMGIRFDLSGEALVIRYPDGRPFVPFEVERQRADAEQQRADAAERRLTRVIELGRKARRGEATADELAELDRLENA